MNLSCTHSQTSKRNKMIDKKLIHKGAIHLIPFPFTDLSQKKIRPCIILAGEKDDVVVVFVTSIKPKGTNWITLTPSKQNGIKGISYIRYTKIATLDQKMSLGWIGTLETDMYSELRKKLATFLSV